MKRYFYISDNLDELERVEEELEKSGISTPHIHVLSTNDAGVAHHPHLNEVEAVLRTDVVHGTEIGAAVGVAAAASVLVIAHLLGWAHGVTWIPFFFLSIVVLGFCTWEGGFFGIQSKNKRFERFSSALREGKHVMFVDIEPENESRLKQVVSRHTALVAAGKGPSVPHWFVRGQDRFKAFIKAMP